MSFDPSASIRGCAPRAMAAGVTSRLWEIGDIVDVLKAWEAIEDR